MSRSCALSLEANSHSVCGRPTFASEESAARPAHHFATFPLMGSMPLGIPSLSIYFCSRRACDSGPPCGMATCPSVCYIHAQNVCLQNQNMYMVRCRSRTTDTKADRQRCSGREPSWAGHVKQRVSSNALRSTAVKQRADLHPPVVHRPLSIAVW